MYRLFGIPNCDSVKKARKHLDQLGLEYEFIDFKKVAPSKKNLTSWKSYLGELPVNKRGTTFRKIKEDYELAKSEKDKMDIIMSNSSVIKRPILESDDEVVAIGWQEVATLE